MTEMSVYEYNYGRATTVAEYSSILGSLQHSTQQCQPVAELTGGCLANCLLLSYSVQLAQPLGCQISPCAALSTQTMKENCIHANAEMESWPQFSLPDDGSCKVIQIN